MRSIIIVSVFAACSGTKPTTTDTGGGDSDADTDADTDTDSDCDSDTDSDTDADTDTGLTGPVAELIQSGEATVGATYVGTESLVAVGDRGDGAEVCRITYDLVSTGPRADCVMCIDWAFDVVSSNATVVTDVGGACLSVVGVDASTVSTLDGQTKGYGYSSDYVGHAQVLLTDTRGYWAAATYATWDEASGAFSYELDDGYHAY